MQPGAITLLTEALPPVFTGVAMFESAEIVAYLRASYQATPPKEREER